MSDNTSDLAHRLRELVERHGIAYGAEPIEEAITTIERLTVVASERWHQLKACEKLNRQLERALKGVLYVAKSEPGPVHPRLKRDIREAEKVLEIVASVKRAKRS